MSLHIRHAFPHQCLIAVAPFLLPSLASAAPVDILNKLHTRSISDNGNSQVNPGMIAGISFAILFGMSILFTAIRAFIDRRKFDSATTKPPPPVTSTSPNAPRVVLVSEEVPIQEPLPAYKLEGSVKMSEEEVEYHSIMATRTQRPPSYSSTAETLNESSQSTYSQSTLDTADFR